MSEGPDTSGFTAKRTGTSWRDYVRIARPDHWLKNVFVLPGMIIAAFMVHRPAGAIALDGAVALAATCLVASANYVINEWLDAAFDQFHPTKKHRPAVAHGLSGRIVAVEYTALAVAGIALAASINLEVVLAEASLAVMGIVYNVKPLRTKDVPYLDVLSESVNNAIRLMIGWFAVTAGFLPPASLVIGYWMGGAFLMGTKRFAEYRMIADSDRAGLYRRSFRHYTEATLLASSVFYALMSAFFTGVFLVKYRVELVCFVPFMFGLFCYYLAISFKEESAAQQPEKLYRERGLLAYVAFMTVLFVVLMAVRIPALANLVDTELIGI
ncbi:MAG: UbiA prenyltransferase family protein [Propionibacteriaceae bacterium]|nr:UbiA prenyltransferase family protein [Propionibacteriaceae bacterium]